MAPPTITFPTTPIPIPPVHVRIVLEGDLMGNMWLYSPVAAGQNLMIWSEEFDNPLGWTGSSGITVTPNDALSPIGDMTADKIVSAVGDNYIVQTPVPCLALTEYTFSVYMRAAGNESIGIYAHGNQDSIPEAHPLEAVTAAWQRFSVTFTTGALETGLFLAIGAYNQFNNQTIWAWGAQLNLGPTATVYTKTTNVPIP
jgi:hypothetical protein